ncbi:hypothetical protein AVEN_149564-1 [Araneus ventricosus]|uniref:RNase H type-1 domain-containing protein n=1 Tax=Araneus ventricosus TaxID=182803 RepID=A0A4Y2G9Y9_ARAVE|nr:hypothetical protein AVEN_149564-1 [Araneus ventricosus]
MVGKIPRLQYSFPGGTSGLETRNRPCNSLLHQPITILMDNQESVQAADNPRSVNTTAREICKNLITNKHIHISWIKAHVCYDGNEEEDRLAKEAVESGRDPLSIKAPISFLKSQSSRKKLWRTGSQTGKMKIRGGLHI